MSATTKLTPEMQAAQDRYVRSVSPADPLEDILALVDARTTQRVVAVAYRLMIVHPDRKDEWFSTANAAIQKRWPKGLVRVKEMAWKGVVLR
jgi:hypothetical protein